jgi:hypothetical protein
MRSRSRLWRIAWRSVQSHGRHDDEAGLGQEGAKAIGRAHAHEIGLSECHAVRGRAAQRILVRRLPRAPLPSKG